ncbi:hypothetical protein BS78_01G199400 [Paspalum vaginatum]|nr:hypothetical protein BS78_01G199400 [Paspalum vaginatum]
MSLRQLLLQARRRCSPRPPQLSGLLFLCRAHSITPFEIAGTVPQRRSPPLQVQLPQSSPSDTLGSGFHIDAMDSDLWPTSFGFSSQAAWGNECLDDLHRHDNDEVQDFDDEIDDMRHRKKLFYKLDRGSKEYEENNVPLRRRRSRDKANAKSPKECKVEPVKSVSSNAPRVQPFKSVSSDVPKLKAKRASRDEVKQERVPTFNQMTDPYHHPFCLDIHVTTGSVRACFVHRVTSRVVAVAHSISKDMKFDLGSRKGKGMKACVAVGALLAKRALEDDIHNALYTPRKGDRIEGKIEAVLQAIIENGVDVKVKLKQRNPTKKYIGGAT